LWIEWSSWVSAAGASVRVDSGYGRRSFANLPSSAGLYAQPFGGASGV